MRAGVIPLVALFFVVLAGLLIWNHQKDDGQQKAQLACIQSFEARSRGMIADAVDTSAFCGCVAEVASTKKETQYQDIQPCMDDYIKPAIVSTCTSSISPRLRTELGLELDCGCMYQEMAKLMWDFYGKKRTVVSAQEEDEIGKNMVMACGRPLSP